VGRSIEIPGLGHGGAPIPQAARVGPLLASGGIGGVDPTTGVLPEDVDHQVRQVFANVIAVLAAGGASTDDVVKMTFLVRDRAARAAIDATWLDVFPDPTDRPARHVVVTDLPGGLLVQAEILASVPAGAGAN
jgi:2-iminobutanoate/2-iminopropanoate deaminase